MSRWVELSLTAAKAEYDKIKDINEQVGGCTLGLRRFDVDHCADGGEGAVV